MRTSELIRYRPKTRLYIALEDYDLSFHPEEVSMMLKLMLQGKSDEYIADAFERDVLEVKVLRLDLEHKYEFQY